MVSRHHVGRLEGHRAHFAKGRRRLYSSEVDVAQGRNPRGQRLVVLEQVALQVVPARLGILANFTHEQGGGQRAVGHVLYGRLARGILVEELEDVQTEFGYGRVRGQVGGGVERGVRREGEEITSQIETTIAFKGREKTKNKNK